MSSPSLLVSLYSGTRRDITGLRSSGGGGGRNLGGGPDTGTPWWPGFMKKRPVSATPMDCERTGALRLTWCGGGGPGARPDLCGGGGICATTTGRAEAILDSSMTGRSCLGGKWSSPGPGPGPVRGVSCGPVVPLGSVTERLSIQFHFIIINNKMTPGIHEDCPRTTQLFQLKSYIQKTP